MAANKKSLLHLVKNALALFSMEISMVMQFLEVIKLVSSSKDQAKSLQWFWIVPEGAPDYLKFDVGPAATALRDNKLHLLVRGENPSFFSFFFLQFLSIFSCASSESRKMTNLCMCL